MSAAPTQPISAAPVGLLAGSGRFPIVFAERARQLGLAVGMAAGIWTGARVLAVALAGSSLALAALHAAGVAGRITPDFLRAATLAVSLGTLGAVIVSVWIAKLWVHGWGGPRARSRKRGAMVAASRPIRPGRTARKRIPEYDAA